MHKDYLHSKSQLFIVARRSCIFVIEGIFALIDSHSSLQRVKTTDFGMLSSQQAFPFIYLALLQKLLAFRKILFKIRKKHF